MSQNNSDSNNLGFQKQIFSAELINDYLKVDMRGLFEKKKTHSWSIMFIFFAERLFITVEESSTKTSFYQMKL